MAYEKFTGEEYIDTDLVAKLNQDFDACGKLASKNTWSADNDFTAGLTVNKTPTVNADVSNKKYVDDSVTSAVANLRSSNNTWTGSNVYTKNIVVSNGTTAGSQGKIILGNKPQSATVQANIISSTTGALTYIATENTGHHFRIGNNVAATSITTNDGESAIFSHNAFEFARVTNVGVAKWLGDANTAAKLEIARTITTNLASSTAGIFDGSANITVGVTGTLPIANGGTGATTAAAARTALGCAPAYTYSTTDLTAGSSALTTGTLYIVYE